MKKVLVKDVKEARKEIEERICSMDKYDRADVEEILADFGVSQFHRGLNEGRKQVIEEYSKFIPICPFCKKKVKKTEEMIAVHTKCVNPILNEKEKKK